MAVITLKTREEITVSEDCDTIEKLLTNPSVKILRLTSERFDLVQSIIKNILLVHVSNILYVEGCLNDSK